MRTVDEVVSMPEVVCTIMAVPVDYAQAEELLLKGGSVRMSQLTPEGHGIQLIEFEGGLFYWTCCGGGEGVKKFPNPTMAGSALVAGLNQHP